MATAGAKVWEIEGWDSTTLIFSRTIPFGMLSEAGMIALLQRLLARHLTPGEIIDASLRRNAKGYLPLLKGRKHATLEQFTVWVGQNPYYTAIVRYRPATDEVNA
jgi:hypothetical protein